MKNNTCFIVDDELKVAERMKSLVLDFTDLGVVGLETNANRAVDKMCKTRPNIVFLDVEMPGKSGFELIDELRIKGCNLTFVLVTGHDHYTLKAIKEAAFDYLLKPVDIDELKQTIERYKKTIGVSKNLKYNSDWIAQMNISPREEEIINLLVQGKTSQEIAKELFLSKHTVDTHRRNILHKTGAKTTHTLIALAMKMSNSR